MAEPDYIVCLNCETPCYVFEWRGDRVAEAFCEACTNDDPEDFASEDDLESLSHESDEG